MHSRYPVVITRLANSLFLSVLGLCVGVGIPALQQVLDRTSVRFILDVPAWGDKGLPFIAGLVSAALAGICALLTARGISIDRFALGVSITTISSAVIGLLEPRSLEPRYFVWIPGGVLGSMLLLGNMKDLTWRLPRALKVLLVLVSSSVVGAGAGYWQMGFTSPDGSFFQPDDVFVPGGAFLGFLVGAIAGPAIRFFVFRADLPVTIVGSFVLLSLTAGCLAANFLGVASYLVTVIALIVSVICWASMPGAGKLLELKL